MRYPSLSGEYGLYAEAVFTALPQRSGGGKKFTPFGAMTAHPLKFL